jgi:hypothetical protein
MNRKSFSIEVSNVAHGPFVLFSDTQADKYENGKTKII